MISSKGLFKLLKCESSLFINVILSVFHAESNKSNSGHSKDNSLPHHILLHYKWKFTCNW